MLCLSNDGYPASLERCKVYVALHDAEAAGAHLVRVIDETGEDYLFPETLFARIRLPRQVARVIAERH